MSATVPTPHGSVEVPSLDVGRRRMVKAGEPVQSSPAARLVWSAVIKDALDRHYGSLKAAAFAMGEYDPSQLTRDLDTGKFKQERLELCDGDAQAAIARALHAEFGNADPKARVLRLIRRIRRDLDDLAEACA